MLLGLIVGPIIKMKNVILELKVQLEDKIEVHLSNIKKVNLEMEQKVKLKTEKKVKLKEEEEEEKSNERKKTNLEKKEKIKKVQSKKEKKITFEIKKTTDFLSKEKTKQNISENIYLIGNNKHTNKFISLRQIKENIFSFLFYLVFYFYYLSSSSFYGDKKKRKEEEKCFKKWKIQGSEKYINCFHEKETKKDIKAKKETLNEKTDESRNI